MPTNREDIAKAMFIDAKDVFMKNLENYKKADYKSYMSDEKSTKDKEKYETVGNLKPAGEKLEGEPIEYGKITDGNTTYITNKTWANGITNTMEAKEDDQWGIIKKGSVPELARTMMVLREENSAAVWNEVQSRTGADGVAYAANNHPLLNTGVSVNDNLNTGVLNFDNFESTVNMFEDWKSHYGQRFVTSPDRIMMNKKRQIGYAALIQSNLKAFESSNTKNTLPVLNTVFGHYLNALLVHFVDTSIKSAVFQRRKGLTPAYDYDKRSTFNFYFNVHERYQTGMINPGFGFITLTGA